MNPSPELLPLSMYAVVYRVLPGSESLRPRIPNRLVPLIMLVLVLLARIFSPRGRSEVSRN